MDRCRTGSSPLDEDQFPIARRRPTAGSGGRGRGENRLHVFCPNDADDPSEVGEKRTRRLRQVQQRRAGEKTDETDKYEHEGAVRSVQRGEETGDADGQQDGADEERVDDVGGGVVVSGRRVSPRRLREKLAAETRAEENVNTGATPRSTHVQRKPVERRGDREERNNDSTQPVEEMTEQVGAGNLTK